MRRPLICRRDLPDDLLLSGTDGCFKPNAGEVVILGG